MFWSYPDGLGGEVALGDHEVASFVQFDDGARVGLHLCFKGLVFLELSLRDIQTHCMTMRVGRDLGVHKGLGGDEIGVSWRKKYMRIYLYPCDI